jgi:hypothetical protein
MLINKSKVKIFALAIAEERRSCGRLTRVSASFFRRIDLKLRDIIISEVCSHPSKGITIK